MNASPSVTDLLQALVRIPSVNPAGNPGTDGICEERCAKWLAAFFEGIGAEVELREVLPERPNVVARFPSDRPGKPRILFAPHTDTVSVAGMIIDPFGGELRDGKIWGRGASDTKGSMAAMLWAMQESIDVIPSLDHEIWFAGLAGEEAGQHGAHALAAEEHFDFVVAGEPTDMQIVHAHKGCTNLRLVTRGTAVHASQPETGENAVYKMAEVVRFIRQTLASELQEFSDPILGRQTISVGTISGGSKSNIVPDFCEATVDIRTVPSQYTVDGEFTARLTGRLRTACADLEVTAAHSPPLLTDRSHPVIRILESLGSRCVGAPWFCDAAVFARGGTPAIAMGPGHIAQAHTRDEWIGVADLERGAETFRNFLRLL